MARSEARLSVDIWNDRDFLDLTPMAQRLYMFLLSQADLTHVGTIGLRERRWSNGSNRGLTVADIERDLKDLEAARYLVIDWDAEEVLVRTFIRGDKVYRQPQVLAVAAEQLTLLTSLPLRVALRVELERIAELDMVHASRLIIAAMLAELATAVDGNAICGKPDILKDPPESFSETAGPEGGQQGAPEGGEQALGDRGTTAVTTDSPNPQDPGPQAPPSVASLPTGGTRGKRAKAQQRGSRIPDGFAVDASMRAWARLKAPDVDIDAETEQFIDHWKAESGPKAIKLDWRAAWQTWIRNAQKWSRERRARASPREPERAPYHDPYHPTRS